MEISRLNELDNLQTITVVKTLVEVRTGGYFEHDIRKHGVVTIPAGTYLQVARINIDTGQVFCYCPLPLQRTAEIDYDMSEIEEFNP